MYSTIKSNVSGVFKVILLGILTFPLYGKAQVRMEPPNWWAGMKNHALQLMLHGKDIGAYQVSLDYPGVSLQKTHTAKSSSYLFLDLVINDSAQPGNLVFELTATGKKKRKLEYPLLMRNRPENQFQGFDASDVIYLITPDRFVNGDPSNDVVKGTLEMRLDRSNDYARHGGDIQGIINSLDYLSDMGFTALWPSPLLINDMPEQSYHGYAITDYYKVDPRFGDLELYVELAEAARKRGIKLIMDQVLNHCGREHWWMKDLPFPDWINLQAYYEQGSDVPNTNHRRTVNQDPYASISDSGLMDQGWFVPSMPDLNVTNPYLGRYMIQNSIWWIETLGLGGIRQDTYPYINKEFSAMWAGAIMKEYPDFSIVGEEWSYNPLLVGYWQDGAKNRDGYASNLTSSMDFPLQKTLSGALVEPERWDTGLVRLYEALANDFYYAYPQELMLFGDNHDMDRLFTQVGESPELLEMALAYLLVAPRIPQIYYGTEIQMQNSAKLGDHGLIRTDFPGGWEGSPQNTFTGEGLSASQIKTLEALKNLLNFRKGSEVIHRGKTLHFAPENGVYVLTRILDDQKLVLILNKNNEPVTLNLSRFSELGLQGKTVKDILSGNSFTWDNTIELNHKGAYILTTTF